MAQQPTQQGDTLGIFASRVGSTPEQIVQMNEGFTGADPNLPLTTGVNLNTPDSEQNLGGTPEQTTETTEVDSGIKMDDLFKNYTEEQLRLDDPLLDSYLTQIDAYKLKVDASSQQRLDIIQQTFTQRKAQMEVLNKSILQGKTIFGVRTGRQRYAPELQLQILGNEEKAGIQRLAELDVQEQQLLLDAQDAADTKSFQLLNQKMSLLSDAQKEKKQAVLDLYNMQQEKKQAEFEQIEALQKQAREAFEFAMDNGINQPFYTLDGYTIFDTASGTMLNPDETGGIPESAIQFIDPMSTITEYTTKTINGRIVEVGMNKMGQIISQKDLGRSGSGSSGSSTISKTQQGWIDKVLADPDLLDEVPAAYYTAAKRALDAQGEDTNEDIGESEYNIVSGAEAQSFFDEAVEFLRDNPDMFEEILQLLLDDLRIGENSYRQPGRDTWTDGEAQIRARLNNAI